MHQVIIDQLNAARAELAQELEAIEAAIARKAEVTAELARIDAGIAGLTGTPAAKPKRPRKSGAAKPGPKPGQRKARGANAQALAAVSAPTNGAHPEPVDSRAEASP